MTSNQLKARELKLEAQKLQEEEKKNRNKETLEQAKLAQGGRSIYSRLVASSMAPALNDELQKNRRRASSYGVQEAGNHAAWYLKDPQMVEDSANISYFTPLGSEKLVQFEQETAGGTRSEVKFSTPGVMAVEYVNVIPKEDVMNTISKNLYAYVRHANSGHTNYEANDLMMYILAVTDVYSSIAFSQRLYSILNTYKNTSLFYAKDYVTALGLDYSTFINNIANFRYKINAWVRRINAFNVPAKFPIFERKMWMNLNIFKDNPIKRSSNYIFKPVGFLRYTETAGQAYCSVVPLGTESSTMNYSTFISLIDTNIDALFNSEDLGIMSGDMLKAYSEGGLFKLHEIDPDFHIEEIYDREVLTQINGATVEGEPIVTSYTIYTDTNSAGESVIRQGTLNSNTAIKFQVYTNIAGTGRYVNTHKKPYINMDHDDVKPIENIIATRLTVSDTVGYSANGSNYDYQHTVTTYGTEVVTRLIIAYKVDSSGVLTTEFKALWDGNDFVTSNFTSNSFFKMIKALNSFDWAPRVQLVYINSNVAYPIADNFDPANFAQINEEVLGKLHLTACLSLYNV